jgi:hypothetical protein
VTTRSLARTVDNRTRPAYVIHKHWVGYHPYEPFLKRGIPSIDHRKRNDEALIPSLLLKC